MLNPFREIQWKPDKRELRKFGLSLLIGFPIFAIVYLLLRKCFAGSWPLESAIWLGGMGALIGILVLLFPAASRPLYVVWYGVAGAMGFVVGNALLAAFYFLLVTPTGLILRALGRSPLRKAPERKAATYWQDADAAVDAKRYFDQF